MNQPTFFQRLRPHLFAVLGLFILAVVYFLPVLSGKTLSMHDVQEAMAAAREIREIAQESGEKPLWTDAVFSGMPGYMIDFHYPYILVYKAVMGVVNILPNTASIMFVVMLSMYVLLVVLGCNSWLSALGAFAYAFGTFSVVSLEAGHVSKIFALGYGAGLLAGVILALRGRYWLGAALTGFFLCMELGANHIQITYYLFMAAGLYVLIEAVTLIRAGKGRQLALGLTTLLVAGALAAGSFGKRLLVLNQYTKESIRGKSELTAKTTNPDGKTPSSESKGGLDKDYAFLYSYGKAETLTLLIPNVYGGGSIGGLGTDSEFYKALVNRGIDPGAAKQFAEMGAPTYWGDQPILGGPAYAGAALLFLFVLGLFVIRGSIRWWLLGAAVLMIMLAWGKNFMFFNELLFDYLPYLNKFRAMTMALCLAQLFLAAGAVMGIQAIVDQKLTFSQLRQPLLISLAATAGVALVLAIMGSAFLSFQKPGDVDILARSGLGEAAKDFVAPLISDRQSIMRADAFRSIILILLTAGALYLFVTNKIKSLVFYPVVFAIVVFDLFAVDKRFLNNADFVPKSQVTTIFEPTPADDQIRQDKSLGYRVFDQTGSFMESNRASYFHRSIGGYNTTRLRRYNELVTNAFSSNTLNILNMLNAKYVLQPGQPDPNNPQQEAGPVVIPNPEALGVAWFVSSIQQVADADAEMAAMKTLNPRDSVVVDKRYAADLGNLPAQLDHTGSTIRMTSYRPDKLIYEANATKDGLAVFSEIYYRGHEDWQAFIDGKPAPHLRANYVLRALRIPAGKHTVEFRFDPPLARTGDVIDLVCNVLLIALIGFVFFREGRSRNTQPVVETEPIVPLVPEDVKPSKSTKVKTR
ncbi:YfhO family protein [Spirosoma daeguense]